MTYRKRRFIIYWSVYILDCISSKICSKAYSKCETVKKEQNIHRETYACILFFICSRVILFASSANIYYSNVST